MDDLIPLIAILAPFILVYALNRMKHERRMRELGLQGPASAAEQQAVAEMTEITRRLETRISNLERVLDSELAGWRSRMPV